MSRGRNLEQTPSLIDADVTDDIGNMGAGIGVRQRYRAPVERAPAVGYAGNSTWCG